MKKNNIVSIQVNKILQKNRKVIIIFCNKKEIVKKNGKDSYSQSLINSLSIFLDKNEITQYKSFNIDSDKFNSEIRDFLYGISLFPFAIIFDNSSPKFIVPLDFDL